MTQPINFDTDPLTTRQHVDTELDAVFRQHDEAIRQLANANRINNELTEAITKVTRENAKLKAQSPAELASLRDDLSVAIGSINGVVAKQHALLDDTGSLARAADIRRRQVAKGYDLQHDRRHGSPRLVRAAQALVERDVAMWPWQRDQFAQLTQDPDWLLHAVALLLAAQDVIDAEDVPF